MYTINRGRAWFIPALAVPAGCSVVDTTGCGNAATAAAMVAWCEGDDPVMAGIKATISANYTLRQGGPYPLFTNEISREALVWAQDIYDHYELKEIP